MKRFIVFRFNTQFIRLAIVCIMLLSAIGQAYAADAIIDDSECTWRLVSSTYALKVGDEVVIAASDYDFAIDTTHNDNKRGQASITRDGNAITFGEDVQIFTLQSGTANGTLAFYTGRGYLYAESNSSNHLKTKANVDGEGNSNWLVSISNNIATIIAQGNKTHNVIQYFQDTEQSNCYFTCYNAALHHTLAIYKKVCPRSVGDAGYAISVSNDIVHGQVSVSTPQAPAGTQVTLTATPQTEYVFDSWLVVDELGTSIPVTNNAFIMPESDVVIFATFKKDSRYKWILVTDADSLKVGDKVVIAAYDFDYAISTTQNNSTRGQATIIRDGNGILFDDDVQVFTLQQGTAEGTFAFYTGTGYLYAGSSSSNQLKTEANMDAHGNSNWNISISNDIATIVAQGNHSHNTMQYYHDPTHYHFACYLEHTQSSLAIYKQYTPDYTPEINYSVTYYGFTTMCDGNPATAKYQKGATHTIPTCTSLADPKGLERTFNGTWNTHPNGTGMSYTPGDSFTVTENVTLYAQWSMNVTNNITLPNNVIDMSSTDVVVYGGTTLSLPEEGTITIRSLTLKAGIQSYGQYAMPTVYIPKKANLVRNQPNIILDLVVNNQSFYSFAVPFAVENTDNNIHYLNPILKNAAKYGTHFCIYTYDGALRAQSGVQDNNWVAIPRGTTLQPGTGYIISAVPAGGQDTTTIRITLPDIDNAWTAEGEQASVNNVKRHEVSVKAHTGAAAEAELHHAGWNYIANPYMAHFEGNKISDKVSYATIPAPNFAYYTQTPLSEATLSPLYGFFVQVESNSKISFSADGRQQLPKSLRAVAANDLHATITIQGNNQSDKTGIIVGNDYITDYEIGADLEKMFGYGNTTSIYTLSHNIRMAYNALPYADATQSIPLGFNAPKAGEYTISLSHITNLTNNALLLHDRTTQTTTNLLHMDYTFQATKGQYDSRFVIYLAAEDNCPTHISNSHLSTKQTTQKIIHNNKLYIIHNGQLYNNAGQLIKHNAGY